MSKVFVEYAIKSEFRYAFLIYMHELLQREGRLELLEGTDQEGLFVEIWNDVTYEEYLRMKKERLDEVAREALKEDLKEDLQADWEKWIQGGIRKLHMWHFKPVSS